VRLVLIVIALVAGLALVLGFVLTRGDAETDFRGSLPPEGIELPAAAYAVAPGLRGKAAAVTFLDTQCTEACPIVAAQIGDAMRLLESEPDEIVAVAFSVDPVNDTPARIESFLERYRATEELEYVDGTVEELSPVWRGFQIVSSHETGNSNMHSAPVRVYDAAGRWRSTLHPGVDLTPANLAHDLEAATER
jgi:cytochrome oxidase Cu insertion factor (SCO1/SenC/PrrC family)